MRIPCGVARAPGAGAGAVGCCARPPTANASDTRSESVSARRDASRVGRKVVEFTSGPRSRQRELDLCTAPRAEGRTALVEGDERQLAKVLADVNDARRIARELAERERTGAAHDGAEELHLAGNVFRR